MCFTCCGNVLNAKQYYTFIWCIEKCKQTKFQSFHNLNVVSFKMHISTADSPATKKPRVQTDEKVLRIPVVNGWKRSTTILAIGKRGFIGEVLYFAPCGKKLKTIPDVMRVSNLNQHGIVKLYIRFLVTWLSGPDYSIHVLSPSHFIVSMFNISSTK